MASSFSFSSSPSDINIAECIPDATEPVDHRSHNSLQSPLHAAPQSSQTNSTVERDVVSHSSSDELGKDNPKSNPKSSPKSSPKSTAPEIPSDGPFVSFNSLGHHPPPDTSAMELTKHHRSKFTNDLFRFRTNVDVLLLVVGILAAVAQGVLPPLNMIIFGNVLDFVGTELDRDSFYTMIYIMAGLAVLGLILGFLNAFCFELLADRQVQRLKEENMKALMRQELGYFDVHDVGTLSAKINNNCVQVRDGLGMKFGQCFQFTSQFFGGYIVGFTKGWQLTLVLSVALPVLAGSVTFLTIVMRKQVAKSKAAFELAGSAAEETFSSIRTVMAFGGEEHSENKFNSGIERSLRSDVGAAKYKALGLCVVFGSVFLTYALGWWFGGLQVAKGKLTGGETLTVFFCIMIASFSLGQLMPNINSLIVGSKAATDILALIDRESLINPESDWGKKDVPLTGQVEFRNVKFYYPARPEKPVFSDLNLLIPAGKSVALVGSSGCGKSTIVQLLERFYDVDGGDILVDGIPLKEFNLKWIRSQLALVSQEPRLFSQTIQENIAYGKPGALEEDVINAAKNANAHQFISQFPNKYQTDAGEGGSMLSGGQKQRISIARAMLRSPAILILDEATSALDNESEKVVQQALDGIISHRKATTIIVAHRLTTIRNADLIIVLDNSDGMGAVVVEQGTHDELVQIDGGLYRQLVEAQTLVISPALQRDATAASVAKTLDLGHSNSTRQLSRAESVMKLVDKYSRVSTKLSTLPKKKEKKPKQKVQLKRLYRYNKDQWLPTSLGCFCATVTGCTWPGVAVLIAEFIAIFAEPTAHNVIKESRRLALWFVAVAIISAASAFGQHYYFGVSGERLVAKMRRMVFRSCLYQDMAFFDEPKNNTGYLSSVISADCAVIRGVLGDNLMIIVQNAVTLLSAAAIAFAINAELAGVALVAFVLVVPAAILQNALLRKTNKEDDLSDTATPGFVMNEVVSGLKTVAAYNLQSTMNTRYSNSLASAFRSDVTACYITGFFSGLAAGLVFVANAISLWYGGEMVFDKEISIKDEMTVIMVLLMAGTGIGRSTSFATDSKKAKESCGHIFAILDRIPAITSLDESGVECPIEGHIKSNEINFRYPLRPEVPVYRNLTFDVAKGQTVALVGESGCGKSTFIQLLERFYDVSETTIDKDDVTSTSGSISIDGQDIRDLKIKFLRSQLGLVSQEPVLFDGTIADNIRYSRPQATMAEISQAAKMANAHSFIERFPDGYATNVGKGGSQLSGGQKQRIAIARALVRDPKILLLDEATSALDAESEKVVQSALDALLAHSQRTTIVIAHRLSTVRNASRIVVLSNNDKMGSRVVEVGTHEELMNLEFGVYRKLVEIANH